MQSGDGIEVIDSTAKRFRATVQIDGRNVRAQLAEQTQQSAAPSLQVTVAQGIPKAQKMDFVVEKLTELGVSAILPLESERSIVADVGTNKIDRWRRLAKTAAAQCGRADIPQIAEPVSFTQLVASFQTYDLVLFPWELAERVPLHQQLPALVEGKQRILIAIGPEGGFSHQEAQAAQAAGAHLVWLGSRILRTETAALVVLSILGYLSGV